MIGYRSDSAMKMNRAGSPLRIGEYTLQEWFVYEECVLQLFLFLREEFK